VLRLNKQIILCSPQRIFVKLQKRELNRYILLEGRKNPEDRDYLNRSAQLENRMASLHPQKISCVF